MFTRVYRILIIFLLVVFCSSVVEADTSYRARYMGTANFSMPTGFTRSAVCYISDSSNTAMLISQAIFGNLVEFSMLRRLNGVDKSKNSLNLKVKILEESENIPSVVYGIGDMNTQLGSKISYFAGSKNIEAFGVKLHAGFYKDPVTTNKKTFYGIEKMVFPLVTLSVERNDNVDAYGIKLSPYPGVSLEFAQRDGKKEIYNVNYYRSF